MEKPNILINPKLWIALEILNSKIKMTDSQEKSHLMAKVDRRSGKDRRQFSYTAYIPERRSGKDRRSRKSRKRTYLLDIEHDGTQRVEEVRLKKC
ncbi:MAG: hypothetical protein KAS40_19775 [Desulfobacterales bacterium]|nr:hypothetical protein [Desulfobacterales bacterium]